MDKKRKDRSSLDLVSLLVKSVYLVDLNSRCFDDVKSHQKHTVQPRSKKS